MAVGTVSTRILTDIAIRFQRGDGTLFRPREMAAAMKKADYLFNAFQNMTEVSGFENMSGSRLPSRCSRAARRSRRSTRRASATRGCRARSCSTGATGSSAAPTGSYIDESGNLDFSEKVAEWFIVTGVAMRRPFDAVTSLLAYKYDCIEEGLDIERFHASEDVDAVHTGVYTRIGEHSKECKAYSAKVHKTALPKELKDPAKVYSIAFD